MIYGILILLLVTVVTVALFLTILRPRKQTSAPPPVRTVGPPKPTPLLASGSFKVAYGFYAKGSYAAAAEAYRQALEGSPDAFDAPDARYRLVESLRAQGKRSAADVEESILVAQLATLPETASTARVRGWLARMQGDIMGAYAAFERAIKMSRPTESIYYYLATELGTTSVSLGRQDLTLYWAEHALSTRLESDVHGSLLNLAGLGARSLGNLDSAERYCAQGLDIARTAGNMKLVSHGMSNLALVYEQRGEYDRALTLAREAVGLNADEDTLCRSILVVILSATGRYKEAIDVLQSTIATLKPASTAIYRDRRGSLMHHLAGITALTGDFENAWRVYEDTGERPGVLQGISNSTQGAWLAAGLGRADARERMIKSYAEIEAAHVHPAAVRNHIKSLVRAAVLLGDADMASRCADQMLNHPQSPTSKSVSWFYVGEAARISGDVAGSRRGYEQSIASGLRNVAVEKARARLSELSR